MCVEFKYFIGWAVQLLLCERVQLVLSCMPVVRHLQVQVIKALWYPFTYFVYPHFFCGHSSHGMDPCQRD